ncbi:MAG TPA: hypothetical protein VHY37_12325, partial [Tepidisphaeraceae bacterium]|nr:hypothetical protein [Tepidisphaeraceae bacterium]
MRITDAIKLGPTARASAFLEEALLISICMHLLAMCSMVLLLPGLPGGVHRTVAGRAAYVAGNHWLWRIGWVPWQLTAGSNLLLAAALLRTKWIPRLPAIFTALVTIAAVIPDQTGEVSWMWAGPAIAGRAVRVAEYSTYARYEARIFVQVAGWAAMGYILAALGWTWCFVAAGIWSRRLTVLSWLVWPIFVAATVAVLLPARIARLPGIGMAVGAGNAVGFVLLLLWLAGVAELVLRRSRPDALMGRYAMFRHPATGLLGRICDVLANARLARAVGEHLPALALASDITDVIYANYLVEADRLERFVDPPVRLQRIGPDGRYALFTFLTFHHGHFGPRCFGPLRRLWPSPIQSNWRVYVFDPATGRRGIQFLAIAITRTPFALAARLLAENIPMHVPATARFSSDGKGQFHLEVDPGSGTAPDVRAIFQPSPTSILPDPWNRCFENWHAMLAYCVPQDRAMSAQPWRGCVTRQEIILDIPLNSCLPMHGKVASAAARAIAGDAAPLCFLVERLDFRLL